LIEDTLPKCKQVESGYTAALECNIWFLGQMQYQVSGAANCDSLGRSP
jgi:hypothetical protein